MLELRARVEKWLHGVYETGTGSYKQQIERLAPEQLQKQGRSIENQAQRTAIKEDQGQSNQQQQQRLNGGRGRGLGTGQTKPPFRI